MEKKQNVPALRFQGFSGEWKERKIEDITGIAYGGGTPSTQYAGFWQGTIPWIQSSDVIEDELWSISPRKHISKEAVKYSAAKVIPKNSIAIITRVGVGKVAFLPFDYATSQDFLSLSRLKIDERFGTYAVWKKINADAGLVQGTSIKGITREEVLAKIIKVPVAENEAKQIGSFFYQFDKKIGEIKSKIQKLQQFRQAMLAKLFPREGAAEPELRFRGFSGKWERRNLLENFRRIIDFRGRTPKKLGMDWSTEGYLALSALNVKDGYIDFKQECHYGSQELYDKWMTGNELHKGQVVFTTEAPMGNVAQIPDDKKYILSQRTIAFEVKPDLINEDFLATLLRTPQMFQKLSALSSGGTAKGISQRSMEMVEAFFPTDILEQKKIGAFFKNLDSIISLQQKKLERMQRLKAALLEKLFV